MNLSLASIRARIPATLGTHGLLDSRPQIDSEPDANKGRRNRRQRSYWSWMAVVMLLVGALLSSEAWAQQVETSLPLSQRFTINLAAGVPEYVANAASASNTPQSHWWYENTNNSTTYSSPGFVESTDGAATWQQVGLPYDANIPRTYINQTSGGGQGSLTGQNNWYRLHFKVDSKYAGQKFLLDLEGTHTGVQVFINGTLLPGISAVAADAQATHVVGFVPVAVNLTPYLHTDGATDNVIAIDVSRGSSWFEQPAFSGAFRFGQAMAGLFRNVKLYVTNPVHIPVNVYSNQKTWGTYVGTVSEVPAAEGTATAASAVVEVQTNVVNESTTAQQVTLTTQIVDANGNVVVTAPPITQSVPAMTPSTFPSGPTPMFDQKITVPNPTLWYPNNSIYGTPYMYKVYHIVSVNGVVVDSAQSPLGIRTITWDADFPYFNGHAMHLWGGSSRYDYPALGSSVPDEQWWRDMAQIAAQGGNIWRPGHSTSSEEMVEAADAYGIMIDQPSGDGEGYWNASSNPTADDLTLKQELHRDMIIRDRSHPSILDWEEDNGGMNQSLADELATIDTSWDSINPRVQADRTYNPAYAFMGECDGAGCEAGVKGTNPNNPSFGAEYWDNMGTGRGTSTGTGTNTLYAYDYELAFAAPYLDDWRQGREANAFGMAQWYFAETPGEVSLWAEFQNQPAMVNMVRSLGYSSVDMNRFPRLLYYIYQANWVPYSIKPVVHLAHHWNRAYEYTAGTPIQENAFSNCPAVRLLINGVAKDPVTGAALADQVPNPWNINSHGDLSQSTTVMPGQVHWMVNWAPGTVTAECIDSSGNVVPGVTDARTTAGAGSKILLSVVPEVVKPDGTSFQWTANGSDAAFVQAEVEDANGNWVPTAANNVTFTVTGPATYMGGSQQLVADPSWTNYYQDAFSEANSTVIGGLPYAFFHSPGDPELNFEGGLQKIALRSTFTPGAVTVTATSPGLASSSVTLTSVAPPAPPQSQAPAIIVPPVSTSVTAGYPATFTVAASGSGTLSYQWNVNGSPVAGATGTSYTTPATTLAQNGESITVTVSSNFGSVTSNSVTLTVDAAANVAITTQPASQTVVVGQSATLTVAATGSPQLNYQWFENGAQVASGPQNSYTTPVLTTAGTDSFYVLVSNPLNKVQSATAVLTVTAPTAVSITTQPASAIVAVNQPVVLTAVVAGSAPYTYQWQFTPTGGSATILESNTQTSNTITYTLGAMSSANVGTYTVTVNNAANAPVTSAAAQLTLAPPGVNLALNKPATSSSTQNACTDGTTTPPYTGTGCLGPENAVDGNLATRWGSATAGTPPTPPVAGVDPSWLQVDLGSVQSFDTVILHWENAYAAQYQIQYTSADPATNPTWNVAYTNNAGTGGTETLIFPTVQGRYIRMYGTQRATQYGYSIYEFQLYNVPQCGGANERYTVNSSTPTLVTDNLTHLSWTRTIQTDTTPGSQFTGVDAAAYCGSIKMRLPAKSEALGISGNNNASCAFPGAWSTWTSTIDPNDASETAIVNFDGTTSWNVTNNYPGATLCTSGATSTTTATPTFSVAAGTYSTAQTVTISDATAGAKIYYTTNGTPPTTASAVYSGPITVSSTETLEAIATATGDSTSAVASASYTITVPTAATPTFSPAAGTYSTAQTVTISDATSGAKIYYTTNGTTPTTASTLYSGPIAVSATQTIKAIAAATGYSTSAVATAAYSIASGGGSTVLQINSGGTATGTWLADTDFVGGNASTTTAAISTSQVANPAPQAVYQTERFGDFTYTIPNLTPGAGYTVNLHFAEIYWTAAGKREFNVLINGTQVLTNFDVFAAAGGENIAIEKSFAATASTSGTITIQFTSGAADLPKVSGIEIIFGAAPPPTAATPTFSPAAGTYSSAQTVAISDATSGAKIYYTTNGTTPTTASTLYSGPIAVGATQTIKAIASATGYSTSAVGTAAYTIASSGGSNVIQINSGGTATGTWLADTDFVGGNASATTAAINTSLIANPAPQAVYQTDRFGDFTYTIPNLTAGAGYTVNLHFAEVYWPAAGKREFNVLINGVQVLTNFDVFAAAGGENIAIEKSFAATASTSGTITIQFTSGAVDLPKVSGIEIVSSAAPVAPAPPTGLTATAASSSQINLSWTASTTAGVQYKVFQSGTLIATVSGTTYANTGLAASTTYSYTVEATNSAGTSAADGPVSATTLAGTTGATAPPTSVTAVGSSSLQVDLRWVASTTSAPNTAPVNYQIYRSTSPTFTPSAANLLGTTVGITNYVDNNYPATLTPPAGPGVQPSTTYYYKVVASTAAGSSTAAAASATTLPATPATTAPAALTGLAAMAENANEIDLLWNSTNSGVGTVVTTYSIYRSTSPTFTPTASNRIGTTKSNWFQDALCAPSTQYYYQVLANNSLGGSPSSATVTAITPALNPNLWGGAPFFDGSGLPAKKNVVMVKFLNRTNGKYTDDQIIWTANINGVASKFTIAQQPYYDMPANSAGRMYFFLNDPTLAEDNTHYWDFIEFTVGPTSINMDTTRVDALGLKIAFNLTCSDGTNVALGEDQQTFLEDRSVTFQRYLNAVPSTSGGDFQSDAIYAPYRIIEPGAAGFNAGGADQNYYNTYMSDIWSFNGITIPIAGPNGSNLGSNPDLSAAIFRHTAPISGTPEFNAAGALTNQGMWGNPASFYQQEPYDHYAQWIEAQAFNMQQYAFPYNDAGGYSSDIGCANPQTLLVAIGW